jgi:PBP1b-binding outer membrane lipoprotein LpoB
MKKLFTMLALGLLLTSCSNTPTKVEDPKTVTTVELQQLAKIDSTTYKVVEKDNKVYILSTKDNMVVKRISNHSGELLTVVIILMILLLCAWIILLITSA